MRLNAKSKRLLIPLLCLLGVATSAIVSTAEVGPHRRGS